MLSSLKIVLATIPIECGVVQSTNTKMQCWSIPRDQRQKMTKKKNILRKDKFSLEEIFSENIFAVEL